MSNCGQLNNSSPSNLGLSHLHRIEWLLDPFGFVGAMTLAVHISVVEYWTDLPDQ